MGEEVMFKKVDTVESPFPSSPALGAGCGTAGVQSCVQTKGRSPSGSCSPDLCAPFAAPGCQMAL